MNTTENYLQAIRDAAKARNRTLYVWQVGSGFLQSSIFPQWPVGAVRYWIVNQYGNVTPVKVTVS